MCITLNFSKLEIRNKNYMEKNVKSKDLNNYQALNTFGGVDDFLIMIIQGKVDEELWYNKNGPLL